MLPTLENEVLLVCPEYMFFMNWEKVTFSTHAPNNRSPVPSSESLTSSVANKHSTLGIQYHSAKVHALQSPLVVSH